MQTQQPLLFVGGDLSGIQKFIYNISSKNAAMSLKGRSAYLIKYTDTICKGLVALGAVKNGKRNEVIYCSGGKFYILVEDSPAARDAIDEYAKETEKDLWYEHYGQLGIAIAYLPFCFTSEEESRVIIGNKEYAIGQLWTEMSNLFTLKKNQKFRHVFEAEYDAFFEVQPVGGDVHVCAITGIESDRCILLDDSPDGIYVLPSVKKQVLLGKQLREKEHFKTFEEYANGSYLGVLRMDVDKLGARFCKGFESMQVYNRFSEHLRYFFENKILELQQKAEYQPFLNIIYAGGDDLFAVGRWDKVILFAADVHHTFMEYTKGENLSISGGIAVVKPKFPIAKAAEMAGEAEEQAKHFQNNEKNAITFLGETVGWDKEFNTVRMLKEELYYQVKYNNLSRGVLHKLIIYANIATEGKTLSYFWHAAYYLTRMKERCKDASSFIENLKNNHLTRGVRHYQLVALAARWAELELRFDKP